MIIILKKIKKKSADNFINERRIECDREGLPKRKEMSEGTEIFSHWTFYRQFEGLINVTYNIERFLEIFFWIP